MFNSRGEDIISASGATRALPTDRLAISLETCSPLPAVGHEALGMQVISLLTIRRILPRKSCRSTSMSGACQASDSTSLRSSIRNGPYEGACMQDGACAAVRSSLLRMTRCDTRDGGISAMDLKQEASDGRPNIIPGCSCEPVRPRHGASADVPGLSTRSTSPESRLSSSTL